MVWPLPLPSRAAPESSRTLRRPAVLIAGEGAPSRRTAALGAARAAVCAAWPLVLCPAKGSAASTGRASASAAIAARPRPPPQLVLDEPPQLVLDEPPQLVLRSGPWPSVFASDISPAPPRGTRARKDTLVTAVLGCGLASPL